MDFRRYILTRISETRKAYFRLKQEVTELQPALPSGTYLSTYTSNSKGSKKDYANAPYVYFCLAHKQGLLPSAKQANKPTYKHHLGRLENHRYVKGILALEKMQILQIKETTLERLKDHLIALKKIHKEYKSKTREQQEKMILDDDALKHDPLDIFL